MSYQGYSFATILIPWQSTDFLLCGCISFSCILADMSTPHPWCIANVLVHHGWLQPKPFLKSPRWSFHSHTFFVVTPHIGKTGTSSCHPASWYWPIIPHNRNWRERVQTSLAWHKITHVEILTLTKDLSITDSLHHTASNCTPQRPRVRQSLIGQLQYLKYTKYCLWCAQHHLVKKLIYLYILLALVACLIAVELVIQQWCCTASGWMKGKHCSGIHKKYIFDFFTCCAIENVTFFFGFLVTFSCLYAITLHFASVAVF